MKKQNFVFPLFIAFALLSCTQKKQEVSNDKATTEATEKVADPLVGSWVEPNPINAKEVQGVTLKEDGTAESINTATLLYKKWWKDADNLVLVSESLGNGTSSVDTTKFQILKLNDKELDLKGDNYTINYKKQ